MSAAKVASGLRGGEPMLNVTDDLFSVALRFSEEKLLKKESLVGVELC